MNLQGLYERLDHAGILGYDIPLLMHEFDMFLNDTIGMIPVSLLGMSFNLVPCDAMNLQDHDNLFRLWLKDQSKFVHLIDGIWVEEVHLDKAKEILEGGQA